MTRSGVRSALALCWLLLAAGCYGFAGGGLPSNIKTVAVLPFDNETAVPELQREITEQLRREMQGRLGVRSASEARADAIVRGRILRYDADVPVAFSADQRQSTTAQRRLQITLDVEIVDQATGRTLWQRRGLTADAEYQERGEPAGRRVAIERVVNEVIEGAQSQW
jgi:hypothetical protein